MAVDLAAGADDALAATAGTTFDVLILDVMLPGSMDGFRLCSTLRGQHVESRVLMLTARDAVDDRVRGLEAGADDYLVKPFAFRELVARVRALTRRHLDDRSAVLEIGILCVDTSTREATLAGQPLVLTPKELAILEFFALHPGQLLSRSQLEQHLWNYDLAPASNLVEVYVGRIRRKLADAGGPDPFVTVRGGGYRLDRDRLCEPSSGAPGSA